MEVESNDQSDTVLTLAQGSAGNAVRVRKKKVKSKPTIVSSTTENFVDDDFDEASHEGIVKTKKIILHLSLTKYTVVYKVAKELGYDTISEDEDLKLVGNSMSLNGKNTCSSSFNLLWADTMIPFEKLQQLRPYQRFNHFCGMYTITKKIYLAMTAGKIKKIIPEHFTFIPFSWSLKTEHQAFTKYYYGVTNALGELASNDSRLKKQIPFMNSKNKVFIMKPNAGCQGRGIIITKNPLNALNESDESDSDSSEKNNCCLEDYVVQEYLTRPLLIEGYKFDLRVYVLITSVKYPSIFIYRNGLVRMCTVKYQKPTESNMDEACCHLTNYAVNKRNLNYQKAGYICGESSEREKKEYESKNRIANFCRHKKNPLDRYCCGSKRDFMWFNKWLDFGAYKCDNQGKLVKKYTEENKDELDFSHMKRPSASEKLWRQIDSIIVKTILMAQPHLLHAYNSTFINNGLATGYVPNTDQCLSEESPCYSNLDSILRKEGNESLLQFSSNYQSDKALLNTLGIATTQALGAFNCFEILGFDIFINEDLEPFVLEVNHTPSFATDTEFDYSVKSELIRTALNIIHLNKGDRKSYTNREKAIQKKRLSEQVAKCESIFSLVKCDDGEKKCENFTDELKGNTHQKNSSISREITLSKESIYFRNYLSTLTLEQIHELAEDYWCSNTTQCSYLKEVPNSFLGGSWRRIYPLKNVENLSFDAQKEAELHYGGNELARSYDQQLSDAFPTVFGHSSTCIESDLCEDSQPGSDAPIMGTSESTITDLNNPYYARSYPIPLSSDEVLSQMNDYSEVLKTARDIFANKTVTNSGTVCSDARAQEVRAALEKRNEENKIKASLDVGCKDPVEKKRGEPPKKEMKKNKKRRTTAVTASALKHHNLDEEIEKHRRRLSLANYHLYYRDKLDAEDRIFDGTSDAAPHEACTEELDFRKLDAQFSILQLNNDSQRKLRLEGAFYKAYPSGELYWESNYRNIFCITQKAAERLLDPNTVNASKKNIIAHDNLLELEKEPLRIDARRISNSAGSQLLEIGPRRTNKAESILFEDEGAAGYADSSVNE